MKKTYLKEIIREIISEMFQEEELVNEKLTDKLPGRLNPAAQQAKQQGLHSIGFGRWANSQGKFVATTVGGKLQSINSMDRDSRQDQPKDRNPKTKPLNRVDPHTKGPALDTWTPRARLDYAVKKKTSQALATPEVQNAIKQGGKFTGDQLHRLTGVSDKAYQLSMVPAAGGRKITSITRDTNLEYDPQSKLYNFSEA